MKLRLKARVNRSDVTDWKQSQGGVREIAVGRSRLQV